MVTLCMLLYADQLPSVRPVKVLRRLLGSGASRSEYNIYTLNVSAVASIFMRSILFVYCCN